MNAKEIREVLRAKGISPTKGEPPLFVSGNHQIDGNLECHAYVGWTNIALDSGFLVITACTPVGEILTEECFPVYRTRRGFRIDSPLAIEFEFEKDGE